MVPVITPDVPDMPWRLDNGVKVFNITVGHVRAEFIPGRVVDAWGFNGSVPGPTIQVNEGDRVRLIVENRLPEGFSMHWHGLEIPNEMDGMPGISQELIPPGGVFTYEFTLHQNGTVFYHSHMAMQGEPGIFVEQTILLGGKLGLSRRIFEREAAQAEALRDVQRQRALTDVRVHFYSALAAERRVDVRRELARLAAEAVGVSRQLFNTGAAIAPTCSRLKSKPVRCRWRSKRRRTIVPASGGSLPPS